MILAIPVLKKSSAFGSDDFAKIHFTKLRSRPVLVSHTTRDESVSFGFNPPLIQGQPGHEPGRLEQIDGPDADGAAHAERLQPG